LIIVNYGDAEVLIGLLASASKKNHSTLKTGRSQ